MHPGDPPFESCVPVYGVVAVDSGLHPQYVVAFHQTLLRNRYVEPFS